MPCLNISGAPDGISHLASISHRSFSESVSDANGRIEVAKDMALERASDPARSYGDGPNMDLKERQLVSSQSTITTEQKSPIGARLWQKKLLYWSGFMKKTIFGDMIVRSTQKLLQFTGTENISDWIEEEQSESQTSIIVRPAPWLIMLGIKYGLQWNFQQSSIEGWKYTLRPFCPVAKDAPIFRFCEEGNLSAVRQLLCNGEASARDTAPDGCTPLHVRVYTSHSQLLARSD